MIDIDRVEKDARARKIPVMLDEGLEALLDEVRRIRPSRILEIGTAVGYSGLRMLECSGGDTVLDTIEIDEGRFREAQANFAAAGLSSRVNQYLGDLTDILPRLTAENVYDIVFIDAAKSRYMECLRLTENALSERGEIIADNVYFRGMVLSAEEPPRKYRALVKRLREFLGYLSSSGRYDYRIEEKGDGVAVIKPKL